MPNVLVEKWALVEVDTDDEAEAVALAGAMDSQGLIEFEQSISLDGNGSPSSKMETALRLIATIPRGEKGENPQLDEVIRIAKRAIPDALVTQRSNGRGFDPEIMQCYLYALLNEAKRRGGMFPQTSDEQEADSDAIHRVCGMVQWYGEQGYPRAKAVFDYRAMRARNKNEATLPVKEF